MLSTFELPDHLNKSIWFCFGIIFCIILTLTLPARAENMTKVIEVEKIIKVPIELTMNDRQQIRCLAENTYFEAGNQSRLGKIAVNNVVMNRVSDARFPKTPCSVIGQKRGGVCQFSWKCSGNKRIMNTDMYQESKSVAQDVYLGNQGDVTGGAKFYHATYVSPSWRHAMQRVARIGAHIFYRG